MIEFVIRGIVLSMTAKILAHRTVAHRTKEEHTLTHDALLRPV